MRFRKGDLSAPILAIIVTVGLISAGLMIMAWFWWIAPRLGKTGLLMVVGTPVFVCIKVDSSTGECISGNLTLTIRNAGTAPAVITKIVTPYFTYTLDIVIEPGRSKDVVLGSHRKEWVWNRFMPAGLLTFEGVVVSDAGTHPFMAIVLWS